MHALTVLLPLALTLASCVVSYNPSSFDPERRTIPHTRATSVTYAINPMVAQTQQSAALTGAKYFILVLNLANPIVWAEYPSVPQAYELSKPWDALHRTLGRYRLFSPSTSVSLPEKGVTLLIDGEYFPTSRLEACASALVSGLTLGIIPYYCDETGLKVRYDLFIDGRLTKTYEYEIRKRGMAGLLLLPFAWANLFTDDLADALAGTAPLFIHDAAGDGYL